MSARLQETLSKYQILKQVFGYDDFRPGQEEVIDALTTGRNALAVMPTGSGKSVCFQIPALIRSGLAVVVSPLVALMQDQVAALKLAGVAAESINSAQDRSVNVDIWRRVVAGDVKILYMAPERLMTERMLAALGNLDLALFAIDEAHCISQWGPAFRPEYEALAELKDRFPGVPIAALTATADAVTRADIVDKLFAGDVSATVLGFDRPNIRLTVEMKRDWKRQLLAFVDTHGNESGIVYCLSRKKTEEAATVLAAHGVRALPYHAGMDSRDRETHQNIFMTEPGVVIVATIAFGMGIDKSDVRFVFHVDLPGSVEAYYQEIGRAGRDGAPAEAHMLYGLADIRMRRVFIEDEDSGPDRKRREHQRLDSLLGYCEAPGCRRQTLLDYFGEKTEPCGNCDLCLSPADRRDGTEDARILLTAIRDTGELYGAAHIIDILRGGETEKLLKAGHERLSAYGAGKAHTPQSWRSIIRQLVATGFLKIDIEGYGGLKITEKGRALDAGRETFLYREDTVKRSGATPRAAKAAVEEDTLEGSEAALLADLKRLRLQLAKERGVPAYVIFPDRALIDMARRAPRNEAEFAKVNGVGAAKLRDFGAIFLDAIETARTQL
jgi:ATP-dependent DNA helicase RecQ